MVVVRITLDVLPEKQLEVMQTLVSMIGPTGNEAGCLSCDVLCDVEDKNRFSMLGAWETRKALDQHILSHRFGALLGSKTLLDGPIKIQIYTVSQSEGMEAVEAVRSHRIN